MVRFLRPPVRKRTGPYSYSPEAHTGPLDCKLRDELRSTLIEILCTCVYICAKNLKNRANTLHSRLLTFYRFIQESFNILHTGRLPWYFNHIETWPRDWWSCFSYVRDINVILRTLPNFYMSNLDVCWSTILFHTLLENVQRHKFFCFKLVHLYAQLSLKDDRLYWWLWFTDRE